MASFFIFSKRFIAIFLTTNLREYTYIKITIISIRDDEERINDRGRFGTLDTPDLSIDRKIMILRKRIVKESVDKSRDDVT